jgi:hypothetical protein
MPIKTKATAPLPAIEEPVATSVAEGEPIGWTPEDDEAEFGAELSETQEPVRPTETQEPEPVARLVGAELLDFYNAKVAEGMTYPDIAFAAGYRTVTKSGRERAMKSQFANAMLQAKGIDTGSQATGPGRAHDGESFARVSGQGQLLVSQLAMRKVGAEAGAVFSVSYPGEGAILLAPTGENRPVIARKNKAGTGEQPGTPLLDQAETAPIAD